MNINSYIVILIYGSLVLLSFLLISNPLRVNKKANFWFGIFLFLWSTFWLEEIFILTDINKMKSSLLITVHFIQFFTPIILYFSILHYSNPDFKFKKSDSKYFVLPLIFLVGLLLQKTTKQSSLIQNVLTGLIIIQALFYAIASYVKIKKHKQKIDLFSSNTSEIDLKWLEYIIIAILILSIFIGVYNLLLTTPYLNVFGNIVSVIIVFFIAYNVLKQKEIFLLNENERNQIIAINQDNTINKKNIISDKDLMELKLKLSQIMEDKHLYLDCELNLKKLAELIDVTPHKLSYIINAGFNENFFLFINKYRVDKAKELLLENETNHLSNLGIAYESGFNSKTSFYTTFKKITNQTPSEFKKKSSTL
ncbi:helix-turn-helix domain-containing protein [Ancylomarina longa]|uniref:AraC family transcriptional regulator n=1 Tax=Ancylomarina longa TaxID=2487017 RepID=A0A434AWU0_9BACT|nr:helix-turn-helix domain-containing protein [Ancylomarina longa]RUT78991.1 AraC family transcriptional regulator [Ancylomarina longa]